MRVQWMLGLGLLVLVACNGAQAGGQSGTESDRDGHEPPVCGCDADICRSSLPVPDGGHFDLYADDAGFEDDAGAPEVTASTSERDLLPPNDECEAASASD